MSSEYKSESKTSTGSILEVVKPQVFNGKVSEFVTVCKLFLRIRTREDAVKEKIQ